MSRPLARTRRAPAAFLAALLIVLPVPAMPAPSLPVPAMPIPAGPAALAAPPAAAGPHFTDPWPDADDVQGVREETVRFTSSDPFAPEDAGRAPGRIVRARLFLPPGAGPDHRVPAVVLLHGSAGNPAERGRRYGVPLAAQGVAVLVVETYAARADLGTSYLGRVFHITETMFVADAYAGLGALARRPDIGPGRVALVGFSYGGMATQFAMYATLADRLAPGGPRFAGFVSYYAPCIARFRDHRATGAPLLMLYGRDDELIHPDRCEQIADDLRAGGSAVAITAYPGAVHQWDGERPLGTIGRHLADCRFVVEPDGRVYDDRTGLRMAGPFLREVILALCTGSRPYPIGRDEATVARSNHDLAVFLARVFGLPPP